MCSLRFSSCQRRPCQRHHCGSHCQRRQNFHYHYPTPAIVKSGLFLVKTEQQWKNRVLTSNQGQRGLSPKVQLGVYEMVGVVQPRKEKSVCEYVGVLHIQYKNSLSTSKVRTFLWSRAGLADRHNFKGLFEV